LLRYGAGFRLGEINDVAHLGKASPSATPYGGLAGVVESLGWRGAVTGSDPGHIGSRRWTPPREIADSPWLDYGAPVSFLGPADLDGEICDQRMLKLLITLRSTRKGVRSGLLHHTSIPQRCNDHQLVCRQEYSVVNRSYPTEAV
jgi:hypothetical protein